MSKNRLLFIDNLRIPLIILVILVHLAITYGAPVGSWYYHEGQPGMIESIFYVFFLAVSQSFFMGFFFMISGYFTPGSYDRKGAWPFFKDKLLRLGIPLLFYIVFIDPDRLAGGGLYWQALVYALWEQFLGVAIIIALTVLFREKYNYQGRLLKGMSASVYTVYIFHAPVIVLLALSIRGVILNPLLKFVLVAPLAVSLCFLLSNYIRKLPIARRIL